MNNVLLPKTLNELWSCLADAPRACVYAGGTDLLVKLRARQEQALSLICLERIPELTGIREEAHGFQIGACTSLTEILEHPGVRKHLPVMAKAVATLGSPPIRNMGTLGGNICTASPAGDTLPPLYVLDAEVIVASPSSERALPIAEFITGPGSTGLKKNEILTAVRLKKPEGFTVQHFEKVGQRKALACAVASLAALVKISPAGCIEAARLAWGSVGPTVIRSTAVEERLPGLPFGPAAFGSVAPLVLDAVHPIDDIRADAAYRRQVSVNLLQRIGSS